MRYHQLVASGYAIHRVVVPMLNVPHGIQAGTPEQTEQHARDGAPEPVECGMRALGPGEDIRVDSLAEAYAKTEGVEKYDDVHPICVKARMIYTLAMACVDPDSDPHKPVLFWGETVEDAARNLREDPKRILSDDTIVYLHERYLIWKDRINPQANTIAEHQLTEMARKAADDLDFLAYMRPGLRLSFTHTLACQHVLLLAHSSSLLPTQTTASARKAKPQRKPKPRKPKAQAKGRR